MGVSSVINDNNGKDKRNKEFNCVDIRRQGSLNERSGQTGLESVQMMYCMVKNLPADEGHMGLIPGLGKSHVLWGS